MGVNIVASFEFENSNVSGLRVTSTDIRHFSTASGILIMPNGRA